jgi:hypothetical protein
MENMKNIWKVWKFLPEEIQAALKKAVDEASSEKQFVSEIGACPKCTSPETRDCDEIDGIRDCTMGLCLDCGFLFCTECKGDLTQNLNCKHWEICENCVDADENFTCETGAANCKKLKSELSGAE